MGRDGTVTAAVPLQEIDLTTADAAPVPDRIRVLVRESERRIEGFFARRRGRAVAGFVPADFVRTYRALRVVAGSNLAAGAAFCEWGSGFGVVTMLAAGLEFRACGIEIDAELVDEADALARDFEIDVEFACGTFVPPGGEDLTDVPQDFGWFTAGGACGHELLGVDPADFDVVFAYPWPGEEQVVEGIFDRYAAAGALLLTFHGHDDLRLVRKVSSPDRLGQGRRPDPPIRPIDRLPDAT